LVPILRNLRDADDKARSCCTSSPRRARLPPGQIGDKYHAVAKFNVVTGVQTRRPGPPSYTSVFSRG
jgi:1-deoxy-D-xylulose-5-phosphate synthase